MKSLSRSRKTRAALATCLLVLVARVAAAQSGTVISAKPGQRTALPMPAAEADGIHISLERAVAIALAANQDLNVTVNAAEASQFFLFQNMGIYDPLTSASLSRAHQDLPASSQLSGAKVQTADTVDGNAQITQLTPLGGHFTLGFAVNRTNTNSTFSTVNPSYTAGLTLSGSQPLLRNFGKLATNILIDTARNTRDADYQTFVRSVQTMIDAVEQAYWDLVYARANLVVKREAKGIATELNRITKIKIDVGSLAPIDIVQTEVGIATAEQDIITAEAAVGLAEDQLRRLLNFEATAGGRTTIVPTDEIRSERETYDVDLGMKSALERRPEILAQNLQVASQELRYQYWSNQVLPQLDLVGGYGRSGLGGTALIRDPNTGQVITEIQGGLNDALSDVFGKNFKNWRVGLVFSYPILNRSARGARGVAKYNLETDRARLTVLEQDIIVNVRTAHRAIETASRQIDAAAKARELAERNLDAARKKYDNGMTTSFEVSQIQVQLSDSQTRELNALAIYRKAVSAYHSAVADILDWKGVRIEGIPERDVTTPPADIRALGIGPAPLEAAAAP
ncbi:MAG: TolC family protein [Thermoanaerobaculia bacterium]